LNGNIKDLAAAVDQEAGVVVCDDDVEVAVDHRHQTFDNYNLFLHDKHTH
jgi:hypothetical protein